MSTKPNHTTNPPASWRAPATDRGESERNVDPPDDQRVAEHQKDLRKRSDGSGGGADEMAEDAVDPQPQHDVGALGAQAPLVDAGVAGQERRPADTPESTENTAR
jgi:hypothetical protein